MSRRRTPVHSGHYYHLYNRGVNRGRIFLEEANYLYFLHVVHRCLVPLLDVISYCLMPTHYHLLVYVKERSELRAETSEVFFDVDVTPDHIAKAMMRLSVSYTKAINKRYDRVGPLFQGAYRMKHVDGESYLLHLSRYIHLNPVAAGLVEQPLDRTYSSYCDYISLRDGKLPHPDVVLASFPTRDAYRAFVETLPAHEPHGCDDRCSRNSTKRFAQTSDYCHKSEVSERHYGAGRGR